MKPNRTQSPESHNPDGRPQLDKFKDLARELEADESEERFEDQVRRIVKTKEPKDRPKPE